MYHVCQWGACQSLTQLTGQSYRHWVFTLLGIQQAAFSHLSHKPEDSTKKKKKKRGKRSLS